MTLMKMMEESHSLHPHCGAAVDGVGTNSEIESPSVFLLSHIEGDNN